MKAIRYCILILCAFFSQGLLSHAFLAHAQDNILMEALKENEQLFFADVSMTLDAEDKAEFLEIAKDAKVHKVKSYDGFGFTYFALNTKEYALAFMEGADNNTYLFVYSKKTKKSHFYGISPQYITRLYSIAQKIGNKYLALKKTSLAKSLQNFTHVAKNNITSKEKEEKIINDYIKAENHRMVLRELKASLAPEKWKLAKQYVVTTKKDEILAADTHNFLKNYEPKDKTLSPTPLKLPKKIQENLGTLLQIDKWKFSDHVALSNVKKFNMILKIDGYYHWGLNMEFITANNKYFINCNHYPDNQTAILFEVPKEAFINLGLIEK